MFSAVFWTILLVAVSLVACSPHPTAIPINSPVQPVNVQACEHTSLKFQHLDASSVRDLVGCLNGDNGALQPYVDFLNSMNTDDLNQLLEIYNQHIYVSDNRLNESLDLVEHMHQEGYLKSMMTDVQVLTENEVAQKFLPVLSRFFESNSSTQNHLALDPSVAGLNQLMVRLIRDNQLTPDIMMLADQIGGLRGKVLALLLSQSGTSATMDSDQVVDLLSQELLSSFNDGSFHGFITHLSDPQLNLPALFSHLSDSELTSISGLLDYLSGAVTGTPQLTPVRNLVAAADQPLVCYKSGSQAREAGNILKLVGGEVVSHADGDDVTRYFLKDLPLLVATTRDDCNYPPAVLNNLSVDYNIALDGFATGHKALFTMLLQGNRFEEQTSFYKSQYVPQLGPLLEQLGLRGATPFLVQMLAKDLTLQDGAALANILNTIATGDLQGRDLINWIVGSLSPATQKILFQDLGNLSQNQKSLIYLSQYVAASGNQDAALKELKASVAKGAFPNSFETPLVAVAKKLLQNEATRRQELKDFVSALVKSYDDTRGGLGDMMVMTAKAVGLSQSTPIQKIIGDTLADQDLVNKITPILWKITRDPKFTDVISFTGKLAANGQLEKVLVFMADLLKETDQPGMSTIPNSQQSNPTTGNAPALAASAGLTVVIPPKVSYANCLNIKSSLFTTDGSNLYNAAQCLNVNGGYPGLATVADHLQNAGALPQAAGVFGNLLVSSPYLYNSLNELQTLLSTGDLNALLKLLSLSAQDPYDLTTGLDGILTDAFANPHIQGTMKLLGKVSGMDGLAQAVPATLKIINSQPTKTFSSDNNYRLQVLNEAAIKAQIKKLMPQYTQDQVDAAYAVAKENFETHNDDWRYVEGPYVRLTDDQWRATIVEFLQDLLRTTDLQEFIAALQDVKNMQPGQFLEHSLDDQRVALHYSDDGQPHIHIESLLDQLEELVLDADIKVPIEGNVGIKFQLAVVQANDLSSAMKLQHTETWGGLQWARVSGNKVDENHFKNLLANYDGLQEIADNGQLKIFQRIYTGLYRATPPQYRNVKDPKVNHMAAAFLVNKIGLFADLTMALSNARAQGQLEPIINATFGLINLIGPNDIEPLKQALQALLTSYQDGNTTPLNMLIDKMLTVEQNPQGYQELKDTLFQVVPGLARVNVEPTGIFRALPALVAHSQTWSDLIDKFIGDATVPQGDVFTTSANLSQIDDVSMAAFQKLAQVLFLNDPVTGESDLAEFTAVASDGYASRSHDYSHLWQGFEAFKNDPQVVAIQPSVLLTRISNELSAQTGLGEELSQLFLDQGQRQNLIQMGEVLAQNGDFATLARVLAGEINSGDVDSALNFIFDNLTPSSVGSMRGVWNSRGSHDGRLRVNRSAPSH